MEELIWKVLLVDSSLRLRMKKKILLFRKWCFGKKNGDDFTQKGLREETRSLESTEKRERLTRVT